MDGTLFVARAQEQFSGGCAIYLWVRSAPLVAPTLHLLWTHLPSIRHAHLHERYAFLQHMFGMGRTKVSWAVRYSRSPRTLIVRSAYHNICAKRYRRISMKMSSCRAVLKRGSVTQHRPHNVHPPTRQGDEAKDEDGDADDRERDPPSLEQDSGALSH